MQGAFSTSSYDDDDKSTNALDVPTRLLFMGVVIAGLAATTVVIYNYNQQTGVISDAKPTEADVLSGKTDGQTTNARVVGSSPPVDMGVLIGVVAGSVVLFFLALLLFLASRHRRRGNKIGYEIIDVKGDGSCAIHALMGAYQLSKGKKLSPMGSDDINEFRKNYAQVLELAIADDEKKREHAPDPETPSLASMLLNNVTIDERKRSIVEEGKSERGWLDGPDIALAARTMLGGAPTVAIWGKLREDGKRGFVLLQGEESADLHLLFDGGNHYKIINRRRSGQRGNE